MHQCGKPLEELSNRIFEEFQQPIRQYPIVHYPIAVYTCNNKISHLQYENFKIGLTKNDRCVLCDDNSVLILLDIIEEDNSFSFRAKRFINPKSLFTMPCDSTKLGIFIISSGTVSENVILPHTKIKKKTLMLKYGDEPDSYIIIPLLHTNN